MLGLTSMTRKQRTQSGVLFAASLLLVVVPFDTEHLLAMVIGAAAYSVVGASRVSVKQKIRSAKIVEVDDDDSSSAVLRRKHFASPVLDHRVQDRTPPGVRLQGDSLTETVMPVAAPVFQSTTWDAEVNELLLQITPTAACEEQVAQIGGIVKRSIQSIFPDADVQNFVWGNLKGGKAFGVAVPDVEIVADICPKVLADYMQSAGRAQSGTAAEHDLRQVKKCAIRACTDRMASMSGLKFRRSAFTGEEPKVTFLAPTNLGIADTSVPFDFSVNSSKSMQMLQLLTDCDKNDGRAKQLILLVRRWAKDRGICFAPKGHFSPYIWSILAIFYMQAGSSGHRLPPFESATNGKSKKRRQNKADENSVSDLLSGFFRFYAVEFDWSTESIAIRAGKRGVPTSSVAVTLVKEHGKRSVFGPSIEDPFMAGDNLASGMTAVSLARLKEELARSHELCSAGGSLSTLLEPWVPTASDLAGTEPVAKQASDDAHAASFSHQVLSAPVLESVRFGPASLAQSKSAPLGLLTAPVVESVRLGPPSAPWRRDRVSASCIQ